MKLRCVFLADQSAVGTYYVSLKILNKSGKDLVIIPSDNNPPQGYQVKKGFILSFTKPTKGNWPVVFKALDPSTQKLMKMNDKDTIEVVPTEVKGLAKTVEILAPGMNPGQWLLWPCHRSGSGR